MLTRITSFSPITPLTPTGGDIEVCFLQLTAHFPKPVDDPWFSAHKPKKFDNATIWFKADKPLSPLGCVTQHQFCNPNLPAYSNCTDWSSIAQIPPAIKSLKYRPLQSSVQALMYQAAWNTSFDIVDVLSNEVLLASQSYHDPPAPLPPNQWVLEVKNIHATMLASMQSLMLAHVSGPSNPNSRQYMDPASTPDEQTLCTSQMATRNDYASFSTLGIAMILALGGVVIIIGLSIELITRTIRKSTNRGTYRQLGWDVSEVLQLQRLAYEGHGMGNWRGDADSVPITAREDRFRTPVWRDNGEEKAIAMEVGKMDSPLIREIQSRRRASSAAPSWCDILLIINYTGYKRLYISLQAIQMADGHFVLDMREQLGHQGRLLKRMILFYSTWIWYLRNACWWGLMLGLVSILELLMLSDIDNFLDS